MKLEYRKLASNGRNYDSKETLDRWNLIAFENGEFHQLATVRWYIGRSASSSTVYCTLWVHNKSFIKSHSMYLDCSGSGQAGGSGYCKRSTAFEDALNRSGIHSDTPIEGRGMALVEECLIALGRQAWYENIMVIKG